MTGTPDHGVMAAYRVLAKDFTRTVVMAAGGPPPDAVALFQQAGAVTVVGPAAAQGSWAPAWRTAMELSWSTASVG